MIGGMNRQRNALRIEGLICFKIIISLLSEKKLKYWESMTCKQDFCRSSELLNLEQKSREFKADYIEYQFLVDDLPMDLKNINTIFSSEDRHEFKGRRENVVMEFIKKDDQGVRSQHTSVMTFSPLANSEDPVMKYGFLNKSSDPQSQLHIKKIKSKDYNFNGTVAKYYVGARSPFKSEKLNISYDVDSKSYQYSRDDGSPKSINVDAVSDK